MTCLQIAPVLGRGLGSARSVALSDKAALITKQQIADLRAKGRIIPLDPDEPLQSKCNIGMAHIRDVLTHQ